MVLDRYCTVLYCTVLTLVVMDRDTLLSIFNGDTTPAQALQTGQV